VKFLVDHNRSPRLASLLRDRGHDAVHTLELGLERAEDDARLMLAAEEGRVIVSADTDFGALLSVLRKRIAPSSAADVGASSTGTWSACLVDTARGDASSSFTQTTVSRRLRRQRGR
jgi:hypothetical protein